MGAILHDLLAVRDAIGLCWLGNLGWLIRAGERHFAFDFDLDLDRPTRLRPSPVPAEDLAPVLDVVFVTHEHGDHFGEGTARILAARSGCAFVVPPGPAAELHSRAVEAGTGCPDAPLVLQCPRRRGRGALRAPSRRLAPTHLRGSPGSPPSEGLVCVLRRPTSPVPATIGRRAARSRWG